MSLTRRRWILSSAALAAAPPAAVAAAPKNMVISSANRLRACAKDMEIGKTYGFTEENLLTEKSRIAFLVWKKSLRDAGGHNNWGEGLDAPPRKIKAAFPGVDDKTLAWAWEMAMFPPTGTINCLAVNTKGEMSGTTTTSGLAWKIPARIAD